MNYSLSGDQWSVLLLTIIHLLGRNSLFIFLNLETAIKNILAENTHENEKISNETYIKTEVEPVPVGKEVDLIINKSCNDKICGTFRHEGKEYKAKIVQPKLQKN